MEPDRQTLFPYLLFDREIAYNEQITLYPVKMKDVVAFQQLLPALILRKDSIFREKQIIKMEYLDFLKFASHNDALAERYRMPLLPFYYDFLLSLFGLVCGKNAEIIPCKESSGFLVNGCEVSGGIFKDLRKIILLQNDVDFDTEEFISIDTVSALEKAKEFEAKKNGESADLEDYIDSLVIALKLTNEQAKELTVRKFWRYIKRINLHEEYEAYRLGQMSGMVTFKEPLKHWMAGIDAADKYDSVKTDESELRSKIE